MIAAVNVNQKVVWGIGDSSQAALDDAKSELMTKTPEIQKKGLGGLKFVELKEDIKDFDLLDGQGLFEFCLFENHSSFRQLNLFEI